MDLVQGTKSIFSSRYILRLPPSCASCMHLQTRSKKKQRKKQQQLWGFGNCRLLIYKRKAIGIPILKSIEYA